MSQGPPFRLRVRTGPRSPERFPADDDALGMQLSALVAGALARGLPRPVFLTLRSDRVDWTDVVPVLQAGPPHAQHMLAAIAGQAGVECVALIGTFRIRAPGAPVRPDAPPLGRALICFIEWPDNRWWTSWRLLGEQHQPLTDDPQVRRAVDGWPRPAGVGGWFSLARRHHLTLRVERLPDAPTVH